MVHAMQPPEHRYGVKHDVLQIYGQVEREDAYSDRYRVHHSIYPAETNSNFGFNLPWWDRLLGTYRDQPRDGHEAMTIGIEQFRTRHDLRLDQMLLQPLRGPAGDYPINIRHNSA